MEKIIIKNVQCVNEHQRFNADILVENDRIAKIAANISTKEKVKEYIGDGLILIPGVIDDQVHFREPGLTHKADIYSESRAAVAGGTTTFMEMPNVLPPTLQMDLLEEKFEIARKNSLANYSFFMGVSNENAEEALKINNRKNEICGLKIFMGSSTGNMLVDSYETLSRIFSDAEVLIATHCEKEAVIKSNLARVLNTNANPDASYHPIIRDIEACYASTSEAVNLAKKLNTRLHILHISTAKEIALFDNTIPLVDKKITAEVCVHHLHFTAEDYSRLGNLIKCNPAIKALENKNALWEALLNDTLDIIATDHAPHTWEEKNKNYLDAPSGLPLVQHSLLLLLDYVKEGKLSLEKMVEKMCHAPATCFQIKERGFLREGYFADMVLLNLNKKSTVQKNNIYYKCGWSPLEFHEFSASIHATFVNGACVFSENKLIENNNSMRLTFNR